MLLLLQQLQSGGQISVGLIECLHGVEHLVTGLAGELAGQIVQLGCVMDVVVQHILQHCHGLGADCASLGMQMRMVMAMSVLMIMLMLVAMAVGMVVLVVMSVTVVEMIHGDRLRHIDIFLTAIHYNANLSGLQGIAEEYFMKIFPFYLKKEGQCAER